MVTYYLFFRVFVGSDKSASLQMAEIHFPAQYVHVKQLANVFLLLVSIQIRVLELVADVSQFFIDSLLLQVSGTTYQKHWRSLSGGIYAIVVALMYVQVRSSEMKLTRPVMVLLFWKNVNLPSCTKQTPYQYKSGFFSYY